MNMNMKERKIWLSQIKRIHFELKQARDMELTEQTVNLINMRNRESGAE